LEANILSRFSVFMSSLLRSLALEGNVRILAIQTFISQIGFGMFYVIWQPYLLSTGIDIAKLGLIQTLINLSTMLGLFSWGYVSDHFGRRPVVIASDFCRIIAILVLILSRNFIALMVFAFFIGFTALFMMGNPARSALIAESVEPTKMATALSALMAVSQGTSTIMAPIGGYIALVVGYSPILYITIVSDVIGFLFLLFYIRETHHLNDDIKFDEALKVRLSKALLPERIYVILYIVMLIQGFGYGVAYSLFYGALTTFRGFTTLELGLMSTSFNLVWALGIIPLGRLGDRLGRRNMLMGSITMAIITVTGFIFSRSLPAFLVFNGVNALDVCFWAPSWTSLLAEIVPPIRRSSVMGKLDAYGKIGSIPAPFIGGMLLERFGFKAPLYVQVITLLMAMFLIIKLRVSDSHGSLVE
jgi:MFS family permease